MHNYSPAVSPAVIALCFMALYGFVMGVIVTVLVLALLRGGL